MTSVMTTLNERHSLLCSLANTNKIDLPEPLTVDFDSEEVGRAVIASIERLLREKGVADTADAGHSAAVAEGPKKTKTRKQKATEETVATQETESNMSATKKTKTAKKSATKKSAAKKSTAKKTKAKAKAKGAAKKAAVKRGDSKTSKVVALLKRAGGATRAEVLKLTGWKAVSMQQLAKSTGVKLKVDESERPFKYKAA